MTKKDIEIIVRGLSPAIREMFNARDQNIRALDSRIAELQSRIQILEARPELKYLGTHEPGTFYVEGNLVTKGGSLWICRTATQAVPGSDTSWQLCCKRGTDGRDLR
jgi:hypothetical protein